MPEVLLTIDIKPAFIDWSYAGDEFSVATNWNEGAKYISYFPADNPGGVKVLAHE